jgi:hypothetical protein
MKMERKRFETIADCFVHRDQENGFADDLYPVRAGTPVWAAVEDREIRQLNGKPVDVVMLKIGGALSWCWMPRVEFARSTKKCNAA